MNELSVLIEEYQAALLFGASITPEESKLYEVHYSELQQLKALLNEQGSHHAISEILARERRSYGWSFLSGTHGERAERAFKALARKLDQRRPGM